MENLYRWVSEDHIHWGVDVGQVDHDDQGRYTALYPPWSPRWYDPFRTHPYPHEERVCVPNAGGEKSSSAMEFDVYNQGMFKTELCNNWQETGKCRYEDNCQFAHGITELRPVIRHPRYKTKVCRTVLTGDDCPYGHRCHFRHSRGKDACAHSTLNKLDG